MQIQNFLKKSFKVSIRPEYILTLVAIWCHFVFHIDLLFRTPIFYAIVLIFITGCWYLYRDFKFSIELTGGDSLLFSSIVLIYFILHNKYLFYNLGGDELYHAEISSFLINRMGYWVGSWPQNSIEDFRKSIWNLFDLRHIQVIDLWRIVSTLIVVGVVGIVALFRYFGLTSRKVVLSAILFLGVLLAWYGHYYYETPTLHPPLRLFPIFIGHLLLGYNDFAFRFPSLLVTSFVSFLVYKFLSEQTKPGPSWWNFLVSIAIGMIPTVFYVAEQVEPSVYGFAVWVSVLLLGWKYLQEWKPDYLVIMGVIAGIGPMMRQTTIAVWALIGILFLLKKSWKNKLLTLRVFIPGLISVPYFYIVKFHGHILVTQDETLTHKIIRSLTSGVGIVSVLNSTTLPWVIFALIGLIYLVRKLRLSELALFLMFFPAYAVFHEVWSFLWGVGRYQAEYVGSFIVLILFYLGRYATKEFRPVFAFCLLFLFGVTLEVNSNLSLDINYASWGQKKITTSSNFPYYDALSYLKRREVGGHFAFVGGQPWYGNPVMWLSGASFSETITWRSNQDVVTQFWETNPTFPQIQKFLASKGVQYLVVQEGTRRERQHRSGPTIRIYSIIEQEMKNRNPGIYKVASFDGQHGGILDIYQISN